MAVTRPTADLTIARHLRLGPIKRADRDVGHNGRVRKLVIGVAATLTVLIVAAVGVDFGAAIYAEYRLARSLRTANQLNWDPTAAILGFPFLTQAARHHYDEIELRAYGVEHPVVGKVSLEATLHDIDPLDGSWLIGPDATLRVGMVESRILIDSTHVGRHLGITDLLVEAPEPESEDDTTESGISVPHGVVFTGTPRQVGLSERVSISVDLSLTGPDRSTLVITATHVLTGPGTADTEVPEDKLAAVLAAFSGTIPDQRLPFAPAPTAYGARGSDLVIEGIAAEQTLPLSGFRRI